MKTTTTTSTFNGVIFKTTVVTRDTKEEILKDLYEKGYISELELLKLAEKEVVKEYHYIPYFVQQPVYGPPYQITCTYTGHLDGFIVKV